MRGTYTQLTAAVGVGVGILFVISQLYGTVVEMQLRPLQFLLED